MTKAEIIEILVDNYREDKQEMKKMKKDELENLLEEYGDDSTPFPNGRDYDSEDWDD
ncbi:hypothetical protein ACQPUI_01620 [Clostridium butyricum]|uniref:hypothetical protein n=1 Tax=Clostridium TaxID=1485 RepID=UPI002259F38F|nr:hypothetical protein [Clostridium sp. LQ25]UZT08391.1 hypothetical protein ONV75_17445 [Clostridium sp. LQ25]